MKRVGIIGFGAFGQLLSDLLSPYVEVLVHDKQALLTGTMQVVDIKTIGQVPLVIIATDLSGIEDVCGQLEAYVGPDTIVMDICSVKEKSQEILQRRLGGKCRILATHPLFGPQSVAENGGTRGLKMAVCNAMTEDITEIQDLFGQKLGIELLHMTAQEHDQEMAWVHGLTFFVGRVLMNLDPPRSELTTHYYQKLLDLVELEKQHSDALFMTIQQGNQHTDAVRKAYIKKVQMLSKQIDNRSRL